MNAFIEKITLAIVPDFLRWLSVEHPYVYLISDAEIAEFTVEYLDFVANREYDTLIEEK